jgi:hypothetical protein
MKWLRKLLGIKPKSYLLDGKYEIVPAFTDVNGVQYFMHKDPLNMLAGRGLTSLVFMEELLMRCEVSYLKDHIAAMEKVLSDPKAINLQTIFKLNLNLKERVELLAAVPDQVYKMASVVFFTEQESPFRYDLQAGKEKIERWKKDPDTYAFFLQTPLGDLIPSLRLAEGSSGTYLAMVQKISDLHLKDLRAILSGQTSGQERAN